MGYRVVAAVFDMIVAALIAYPFFHFWGRYNESNQVYQVTGSPAIVLMLSLTSYFFLMEWAVGATLGKLICDLRVVSLSGEKCSLAQSLKRNLLRAVDIFPFYLAGFVAAKLSPLRQRLGDQWAKTIVVKKDRNVAVSSDAEIQRDLGSESARLL